MPLFKTINHNSSTKILVWKITETFDQLLSEVRLNPKSVTRLKSMKSEVHQLGFLSVRKLLQKTGYSDFDLFYDVFGKPHLTNGTHISISHSHQFSAIVISDQKVGIDIELQREKIIRIANKFSVEELSENVKQNYIQKLTQIWAAKEVIFKIRNEKGISFKDHIFVNPIQTEDKSTKAILKINNTQQEFSIHFEEIQNFVLAYAFEI